MAKGKYHKWITKSGLQQIEDWARMGLTDEQMAHNMGINVATLYEWKNRFPEIVEAQKRGKEVVDQQVENALLKRALGYEYEEITYDADGKIIKRVKKEVVPDTTAQIFWLKNRKPDVWRDRRNLEHTGKDGGAIEIANMSTSELKKLAQELLEEEEL
ncbi:helix-turn-helix domain-containing protein [Bacillaceae bacterium]